MLQFSWRPRPGSELFVGIDVSITSWHLTVRCQGQTVLSTAIPPTLLSLEGVLKRFPGCRLHSVYEAGGFGYWLHDWLLAHQVDSIVVSPAHVPLEAGNRVKTDRRDSLKLATLLEAGILRPIFIPPLTVRGARELVRQRDRLQRLRRASMNRLKSLFLAHAIQVPFPRPRHWGGAFCRWLETLTLEDTFLQETLHEARGVFFQLDTRLKQLDARLRQVARCEPYDASTALLTTVYGIGELTALTLSVEVVDWSRFPSGEVFSAYVGLTPSQYSSGDKIRHGRITRTGNRILRSLLVEASWFLIRKDPTMRAFYEKIKIRRGAKRAIIAVARKLCHRLVAMNRKGEAYRVNAA